MGILISVITITLLVLCYVRMYNRLKRLSVKVQEGSAGIDVALEKRYDMLSEEIEAVKKYLAHEYQIYTEVTSTRAGKKLNESIFQEKKQLSEEAVKAISETITEQQKQMETIRQQLEQQRGQDNSLGAETPGMGGDGLIGHQVSLDRKLGLLASAQQGLTGVNSAINALAEQYPTLYSYASMQHFQQDIFDAEEHLQAARRLYNSNVSLYNQRINTLRLRTRATASSPLPCLAPRSRWRPASSRSLPSRKSPPLRMCPPTPTMLTRWHGLSRRVLPPAPGPIPSARTSPAPVPRW